MKFWIGVASKEHVEKGIRGGFCQLCHGKEAPLKRMQKGDYIIYYSSKIKIDSKIPCQKFTAIGKIIDNSIYRYEMFPGFTPFRRDVRFFKSRDIEIKPLLHSLSFIRDKTRWGYPFRYGHLQISKEDFLTIAQEMLSSSKFEALQKEINSEKKLF